MISGRNNRWSVWKGRRGKYYIGRLKKGEDDVRLQELGRTEQNL